MSTISKRFLQPKIDARFDLKQTRLQLQILSGEPDPVMDFRIVPESAGLKGRISERPDHKRRLKFRGRLSELAERLKRKNAAGYAVYILPNETDGVGVTKDHVTSVRILALDLDRAPLPPSWELKPHLIVETSPGRYQCFWAIEPTKEFSACE